LSALFAARRMTMALHCHAEPCFPKAKHPEPEACTLAVTAYEHGAVP
jgi:hypothetical protein